jgi:ATP-dependent Clp protease adapter protein ClpS
MNAEKKRNIRREVAEAIKSASRGAVNVIDDATNPYAFVVEVSFQEGDSKPTRKTFRVITKEID